MGKTFSAERQDYSNPKAERQILVFPVILGLFIALIFTAPHSAISSSQGANKISKTDSILFGKTDEEKVKWLLEEGRNLLYTNPDTSLKYAEKALEIATKVKKQSLIIMANLSIANSNINLSHYPEAYEQILVGIQHSQQNGEQALLASSWRALGVWYDLQGDLKNALENYYKALAIYESLGDDRGVSTCFNNIGIMLYELNDIQGAIEYYKKSIVIELKTENSRGLSKAYCNLGNAYEKLNDYKSALEHLGNALDIDRSIGDKQGMAANLHNIGLVYLRMKEYDKALSYFRQSLTLCEELNDIYRIITRYTAISETYNNQHDYQKALTHAQKALELSREIGSFGQQKDIYVQIIESFRGNGNYFKAFETQNQYGRLKDSLFDIERVKEIALIRTKYKVEQQQQDLDKANILAAKDRVTRNAFIAAFILSVVLIVFIFQGYRNKITANRLINEKNVELELANAEILAQRDEVEAQRDMVISQKEKIEEVHNHITHSLRYAQSIQAAILPSEKVIQQISSQYFVMMKPCEFIGGDFYWATTFGNHQIFCVADCTGHGVPGAFMSILGITALNDIVTRHRVTKPSEILGYLRESVIEALSQNDPNHLHKDGMDIALCVLNTKTGELQFAGAGLPLWIVSHGSTKSIEVKNAVEPLTLNDFTLHELKGDIMPVGQSPRMEPFANHSIMLNGLSISIYLATDGFADQIGGSTMSKFGSNKLKTMILQNAAKEFVTQAEVLEKTFEQWMGISYQIDDATVLGLKI